VTQWPVRGALAALIAFSLGWDLWAVLTDLRLSGSDTFTPQLLSAYENYQQSGLGGIIGWMGQTGYKEPLAPLLTMPLLLILDQVPLAPRLVSVLAHAVLTWQCYHLARCLGGRVWAGLWAALIMITTPLIFGWARLSFHEPLLAVMVLGALQVMARAPLVRFRQAVLLGLLLGLDLLTKLSFIVFMVAPGVWFVLRRHGEEIFMLMDRGSDPNRLTALFQIWRYRGRGFRILDLNQRIASSITMPPSATIWWMRSGLKIPL